MGSSLKDFTGDPGLDNEERFNNLASIAGRDRADVRKNKPGGSINIGETAIRIQKECFLDILSTNCPHDLAAVVDPAGSGC